MMLPGSEAPSHTSEAGNGTSSAAPKFSVVIPTCHRNDLLAHCLDCLAPDKQGFPADRYEVIVTDDGSRTTAQELMRERYPWARWVAGPRRGPAANRNNGARQASGEWIVFTDDDCLPEPGWLAAFEAAVQPGVVVYEGRTTCKDGLTSPLYTAPINLDGGCLWSCNMMIARDIFVSLNGFDEAFPFAHMEDVDFRERLKAKGYAYPFVHAATVDHPPRPLPPGKRLGLQRESSFMYYCRKGIADPFPQIFRKVAIGWLQRIRRKPLSSDAMRMLGMGISELATIAWYAPQWRRKYAGLVAAATAPSGAAPVGSADDSRAV